MELSVFCSSLFVLGHSFLPFSLSCCEFSARKRSSATFLFSAWPVIFFGVLVLVKLQSGIPRNVSSIESTFELFTHRDKAPMIERRGAIVVALPGNRKSLYPSENKDNKPRLRFTPVCAPLAPLYAPLATERTWLVPCLAWIKYILRKKLP